MNLNGIGVMQQDDRGPYVLTLQFGQNFVKAEFEMGEDQAAVAARLRELVEEIERVRG